MKRAFSRTFQALLLTLPVLALPALAPVAFAQVTTLTVLPSVTTSSVGAGVRTVNFFIACLTLRGEIIPNCDILFISHQARPFSGGHAHHDAARPKGEFTPTSGNTGPSGLLPVTYTAPEVAGVIDATFQSSLRGTIRPPSTFTIGVRVPGLAELPPGENYVLVGSFGEPGVTSQHVSNHFGLPSFNRSLQQLADRYAAGFPGQRLEYNDMSLPLGGLFDVNNNWRPPHHSHRFGTDVDVRLVPPMNRDRLRHLIRAQDSGIRTLIEETRPSHWHLRQ